MNRCTLILKLAYDSVATGNILGGNFSIPLNSEMNHVTSTT